MKTTAVSFVQKKSAGNKITLLTAYDYTTAKLIDSCGVDGILVGDSLGTVCLGYADTLSVTMEDMLHHTQAVARGVKNALLIADMPFMSYQTGVYDAVKNAGRLVQSAHAEAVKLEGGSVVIPQVKAIIEAQIPVMGHLGLTPQSVHVFGGYKVQGRDEKSAQKLLDDAKRLEDAGVFAIVLECIPRELAQKITSAVSVPTIGIGAGVHCDGQVLVFHDMMNLYQDAPHTFVKIFEDLGEGILRGVKKYVQEVQAGTFPDETHSFTQKPKG